MTNYRSIPPEISQFLGKAAEITVSGGNNSFIAHADTVENNITVMLNDPRSRAW